MAYNLTFAGAGFQGVYHIGVISCIRYYGKKFKDNIKSYGGCSAGAMTAIALLCDMDIEQLLMVVMGTATEARKSILGPFSPFFDPVAVIRKTFSLNLPKDAYKIASGKIYISMTRVSDWKNVVVSEFASNRELIDALICSSYLPFFCGVQPPKFKGESYIDGCFTDNLLQHFEGTTITVSPFSGESDICPDDGQMSNSLVEMHNITIQCNGQNMNRMIKAGMPPDVGYLTELCRQGFKDTLKYLNSHYPEMLTFDVGIVSNPQCCGENFIKNIVVEENCLSSCCEGSIFSDIEKTIAEEVVIRSLIFPEELIEILSNAELIAGDCDILWIVMRTIYNIARWLTTPCYYLTQHIYEFANAALPFLLAKIENHSLSNPRINKILKFVKKTFYTYHDSATFELHPSLGEEQQADIIKTRGRLLKAQTSLATFPRSNSNSDISTVSSYGSDLDLDNDFEAETETEDQTKCTAGKQSEDETMSAAASGSFATIKEMALNYLRVMHWVRF